MLEADVNSASFRNKTKQFLSSKLIVFVALVGLTIGAFTVINKSNAAQTDFSQVYQYYLLSNSNGKDLAKASTKQSGSSGDSNDGGSKTSKKLIGLLGNGGNQGSFSYDDIYQGADNKPQAKKFNEIMATLSGYNYISVQSNGMDKICDIVVHFLVGVPLLIIGFFTDVISLFWTAIVDVIAEYNIFNLLGTAFGYSKTGDQLASALGISQENVKNWISMGLWIFTAVMLFTVVWALRRGGTNVTSRDRHKLVGRAMGLIGIPIVICMACSILSGITNMVPNANPSSDPAYAGWLMDVESWAKKHNFDVTEGGIKQDISQYMDGHSTHGNYVDPNFNPYLSSQPAYKIGQTLYQDGLSESKTKFPNSTIAMSYLGSQTFDARDYLDYIATNDINNLAGKSFKNESLYDFSTAYDSSGNKMSGNGNGDNGWDAPKGMNAAKDDYEIDSDKSKLGNSENQKATPVQTWEDRYIFGAKNTGFLSKYYKEQPSMEQIYSQRGGAGSNSGDRLTDESTFLVLNTKFDSEGGDFSIDGPTYGAYATISKFDSNRYSYYKYSMVGSPLFTIPAMTVEGLMNILIGCAVITALWSVGIVDMNLKPLRAWMKSISFGDIEYAEATMIYALGIAATALMITFVPSLLLKAFISIANMIGHLLVGNPDTVNSGGMTVAASEMLGTSYWYAFAFAILGLMAFFKNWKGFRDKLIEFLIIPWEWADGAGRKLEEMAGGETESAIARGRRNTRGEIDKKRRVKNNMLEDISRNKTGLGKTLNDLTNGKAGDLADKALMHRAQTGDYTLDTNPDGLHTEKEMTMDEIKRRGDLRRMGEAINSLGADTKAPGAISKDFAEHANPDDGLSEESLYGPDGKLNPNNPFITDKDKKDMHDVNNMMDGLGGKDLEERAMMLAGATGLTPEEAQDLQSLHNKENQILGEDAADDYRNLQHKLAQGKQLTPDEQKRLDDYNQKLQIADADEAKRALGDDAFNDYQNLTKKATSGQPLTADEQNRLNGYNQQLRKGKAVRAKEILGPEAYEDYQELQKKAENGQPLTADEQKRLNSYNQELRAADDADAKVILGESYPEYRSLQRKLASGQKLTPSEQAKFKQLKTKVQNGLASQALGESGYRDYKKLQQKAASGQSLSPAEKSRMNSYRNTMKQKGFDTNGLTKMKDLEQKAAPTLTGHETAELNTLQTKLGNVLGDKGLQEYQNIQSKAAAGQKLNVSEQKALKGYSKQLQDAGVKPGEIKHFNDLQSKGRTGLTIKQNQTLQSLMSQGAKVNGMNANAMKDFARLSQKQASQSINEAESKRLKGYVDKLQKSMQPKDVKKLQRLASRKVTNRLNPNELKQMQSLQQKRAIERQGIVALSNSQQRQLSSFEMARRDAVKTQAPKLLAKLDQYNNMRGELNSAQQAEYRKLMSQVNSIGDKAMSANDLREYKRLSSLRYPKGIRMTSGEKAQLNALEGKATASLNTDAQKQAQQFANEMNKKTRQIAHAKDRIVHRAQTADNIQRAKVEKVQASRNNVAQLANVRRAFSNFATRGGSPDDANKLLVSVNQMVDSTKAGTKQRAQAVSAARKVINQLQGFEFASRGSVDTNGDGRIGFGDAGMFNGSGRERTNATNLFYKNLQNLSYKLDKIDNH